MNRIIVTLLLVLVSGTIFGQDPIDTDGDKYTVLFENERLRVLDYHDLPGEKTHQHHHPAFVLYAISAFQRNIHLPDGSVIERNFKAGDVIYSEAQTHIGENIGTTPTHAIMVELKSPAALD
jgi:hypothetical protein